MAGLIVKADIEKVKDRADLEEIVSNYVTLRPAGINTFKGLCPFHDENTPSFNVNTARGFWHCFGCGEGGDAISFLQKIDHLSFTDAVEHLAQKYGITLRYEDGKRPADDYGKRQRLLDMHRVTEQFYREQLDSPQAQPGREFLLERGFSKEACAHFGVGFAPGGWNTLANFLRAQGFTEQELVVGGLASAGSRGLYDRFRGRLVWPIRDLTGATIGFGARRILPDDQGPKYLNTPETPIYHKSKVLYGLDLAKRAIATKRQVVVVEGYTDVMAAHLAGIDTAVASCGTAFGSEHVKIIRRLLGDMADPSVGLQLASGQSRGGEVIFTFDGDAAGQKAALKAYGEDQNFALQTFVAVEKRGMDPCDLRIAEGDEAVVRLIKSRIPLFEFVLQTTLAAVDLSTAEGRVIGLRAAAPVVASIRDRALQKEYVRLLSGWLGIDAADINQEVRRALRSKQFSAPGVERGEPQNKVEKQADEPAGSLVASPAEQVLSYGDTRTPRFKLESQALAAVLQRPYDCLGTGFDELELGVFTSSAFQAVHQLLQASGGLGRYEKHLHAAEDVFGESDMAIQKSTEGWNRELFERAGEPVRRVLQALLVVQLPQDDRTKLATYARSVTLSLVQAALEKSIVELRFEIGRLEASGEQTAQHFQKLLALEERRRALEAEAIGHNRY
ncbi:DNA primase [Gleimia sp. 6138-11-ORH1]|uniref:DNA primase n=1 Tax=Gleimia sp. 6138-11-ORH1 TaxID=2973937 RepID=UPI002169470A|nr:DNA primase [Gleimia sp. 6138-11-ORH1]MCS4484210.1 DNA primase [Gleimia sp. 6138-11-ORH1]